MQVELRASKMKKAVLSFLALHSEQCSELAHTLDSSKQDCR